MKRSRCDSVKGFTFIEAAAVTATIAILVMLLVPAVAKVRESSNRSQCAHNLKQMGVAFQAYNMTYGKLPCGQPADHYYELGWAYALLPHLGEEQKWRALGVSPNSFIYGYGVSASDFTDPNSQYYNFVHLWNYKANVWECPSAA